MVVKATIRLEAAVEPIGGHRLKYNKVDVHYLAVRLGVHSHGSDPLRVHGIADFAMDLLQKIIRCKFHTNRKACSGCDPCERTLIIGEKFCFYPEEYWVTS